MKLFTKQNVTINKTLPTQLNSKVELLQQVADATKPTELANAVVVLAAAREYYDITKKAFNVKVKNSQTEFKAVEKDMKSLELHIKERALEVLKTDQVMSVKQDVNDMTGEVKQIVKVKDINNLGKNMFTHTPEKTTQEVDIDKIIAEKEKYAGIVKEVVSYQIDMKALQEAMIDGIKLPMKVKVTPAKIGIQWKSVKENADKLLEAEQKHELNFGGDK